MAFKDDWKNKVDGVDYVKAEDINQIAEEVIRIEQASSELIVGNDVGEKCAEFSAKLNNTDKIESFVFFTDPHLLDGNFNESKMHEYLQTVEQYYKCTPTSFVLCGGDWIGNSDTQEVACFKLGYLDGYCRALFSPYYPVNGNHDINEQGKLDENSALYTGKLSNETVRNLMYRENGAVYYRFEGTQTAFFVFDTSSAMYITDEYKQEQLAWFAEKLLEEQKEHIALALHIGFDLSETSEYNASSFTNQIMTIANAYNAKTTTTVSGNEYDFSGCDGMVKFALCGHIHDDYSQEVHGIPLIATANMQDGGTPTFEMCLANYDANVLHLVRVGTGENRMISLPDATNKTSTVFLPDVGFGGNGLLIQKFPKRMVYVSTVADPEGLVAFDVDADDNVGTYYPIKIPDGATSITVSCPGLYWGVHTKEVGTDGSFVNYGDPGWQTLGGSKYNFIVGKTHFRLSFKKEDESPFGADYDTSGITISFN